MAILGYETIKKQNEARQAKLSEELAEHLHGRERCVLEIGCGHGHYLTAYAAQHPHQHCIGIDLITKRVEKGLRKVQVSGLDNLHFIKAEVSEFLLCLPAHVKLEAVFMLFPDPWPKKRHHKNRMIQPAFLTALAQRCEPETPFYYRTDHEAYFSWTREHIEAHPHWRFDTTADWPFENGSFFQNLMESYQSLIARRV